MPRSSGLRVALLVGVGATLGAEAGDARAAARDGELEEPAETGGFEELTHEVEVRLDGPVARYRVRRVLAHPGGGVEELSDSFALPVGGAVTGFRVGFDGQLLAGKAMPAARAAARYEELREPGDGPPRLFGLMSWDGLGRVGVAAFPVFPGEKLVVEYDVTAPLAYAGGRLSASYPAPGDGERTARLRASAAWAEADVQVTPPPMPGLGDPPDREISARPPAIDVVAVRLATLALAKDRHVVRWELDVAPVLGQAPRRARVVFVVDASWSQDQAGVAAQLQVARAYLGHVPDADFAVIGYARDARTAVTWSPAAAPGPALASAAASAALAPRNGSDPAAGLRAAAALVKGERHPVRVVLLSDLMLPSRLAAADVVAAAAGLPKGAVLHVVARDGDSSGAPAEARIDPAVLGPAAEAHGGQVLEITGDEPAAAAWADVTLGLVRPVRLDDVSVELVGGGGEDGIEAQVIEPLQREGEGLRQMAVVERAPTHVVLRARRWAEKIERRLAVSTVLAAELPALAVGDADVEGQLEDADAERLGLGFGLVTRGVSLLAEPVDAEAAVTGFEPGYGTLSGRCGGVSSCGTSCRMGTAYGTGGLIDWAAQVRAAIAPGVAACARQHGVAELSFDLQLELTDEEIVGLAVEQAAMATPKLARCVEEAIWATHLPGIFHGQTRREFRATVSASEAPSAPAATAPATPAR